MICINLNSALVVVCIFGFAWNVPYPFPFHSSQLCASSFLDARLKNAQVMKIKHYTNINLSLHLKLNYFNIKYNSLLSIY